MQPAMIILFAAGGLTAAIGAWVGSKDKWGKQ
jgi:hypothetical protein